MFQNKYFVIFAAIVYLVLIILFQSFRKVEEIEDQSCYFEKPCVRFCCKDQKLCDEKYIEENFNASVIPDLGGIYWNVTDGIRGFFGKPKCTLKLVEKSYNFSYVSKTLYYRLFEALILVITQGWSRRY
jgi:hypothetical protein